MNILTVDDDAVIRRTLAEILKTEKDWKILDADDGEVAWQMLDNGLEVDMCILDNVMPRLTGIELIRRLRGDDRFKALPIILVTLNRDRNLVMEAIKYKVSGFILKPFEAARVIRQVKDVAGKLPKRVSEPNVVLEEPEAVISRLQIDYKRYLVTLDVFIDDIQSGIDDVKKLIDGSDVLAAISRIDAMKGACVTLGAFRFKKAANSISQVTTESVGRLEEALNEVRNARKDIAQSIIDKGLVNELPENDPQVQEAKSFNERQEVLLVEDKPAIVKQFKENLASNDWKIQVVGSGREVMGYVLQSVPSVIIMSLSLPEEAAFESIRFLRSNAKTRKIPVWGLSIKTANHEHRKAQESGFSAIITKPIDFDDVRKRLLKTLNIETKSGYFETEEDRMVINLPKELTGGVFDDINSGLSSSITEAIDNGCSKIVINGGDVESANHDLIEFLVDCEKTCTGNSMPMEIYMTEDVAKSCKEVEDCKEFNFIDSLAAASTSA